MELSEWHMWWKRCGARGIRRLLMEAWDPIGVRDVPEAADEYDAYVGRVGRMLREGTAGGELAAYLEHVRTERMGLAARPDADRAVAEALLTWYDVQMRR